MNRSFAAITDEHLSRLDSGTLERVFGETAAFTRLLGGSHHLAKALSDIDTPAQARAGLLRDLLQGALSDATIDLAVAVAGDRRVRARDLGEALVQVTALVGFAWAEQQGELDAVQRGLFDFADAVRSSGELRDVLTNPGVNDAAKLALVTDVLQGKVDARALEIVRTLVTVGHGRDADETAWELGRLAASRGNNLVAEVRSAVPLDADHQARLLQAISATVGSPVAGRFSVDSSLVGSVAVRVGDEVFDGSVRHRLDQARKALVNT